jgi:long-chain acyl-CoA synthetase
VNRDPKLIRQTLLEVQPTLMCNVPRFWEKVYAGVQEKISSSPPLMRWLFAHAIKTGHAYHLDYRRTSCRAPLSLSLMFWLYDRLVYSTLKRVLGLKYGRLFPVAGAPLSDTILEFLLSVNIPLRYGYGLSETSATVCFHPESGYTIGSIGTLMPDISVRIDPANDEILVKGGTITSGYYRKPEATAEVFTLDGYFRTGDAGWLEGDTLFFRERIKDLYKTSNGKYIAPQAIEMSLSVSHYIEQCAVIADSRKFVSALIVPAFSELEEYAKSIGLPAVDRATLLSYVEIRALYEGIIAECQHDFAPYERIKRFVLLPAPFTMESGELTDTLKLRRPVIAGRYASEIDSMYRETL